MTDRLPDRLESNARVEVRADGVVVGTRRIVDLVGDGITVSGTDDGVNDVVTVTLEAAGSAAPSGVAGGVLDGTYPNPGLAASVAGDGLSETTNVLSVNPGTGLEIDTDTVALADTGVVPGSYGGVGLYVSVDINAQGQITAVTSGPSSGSGSSVPPYFFGDGSDGAVTVTQTTSVPAWASVKEGVGSAIQFFLGRDLFCTDFTLDAVDGTFGVDTNGYRIYCTGTLTVGAGIRLHADGRGGAGGSANKGNGIAGGQDPLIGSTTGQTAGSGSPGSAPGASPSAPALVSASIAVDQDVSSSLTNHASGGAGGAATGAPGTGGGTAGGLVNHSGHDTSPRSFWHLSGLKPGPAVTHAYRGGGGGTGGTSSTGTGGRGGGGGGVLALFASTVTNNGTLSAVGGVGAAATLANAGGGGGGGGGAIVLVYQSIFLGTTAVTGSAGGAGAGTGKDGAVGQNGLVWQFPV